MAAAAPAGDEIPRVGVTLAAIERFRAELAAATQGLPDAYVPGDGAPLRRTLHEHALVPERHAGFCCSACSFAERSETEWHACRGCDYDECAACFAESERLAALPPEPPQLTTADVSALATMHLTGARRCAYASLLDASDASLVGEATVFVSHAWAMSFDALVAALRESERDLHAREPARTPYFWLDLLVNDQFAAPSRPFEWWQTVFRDNVRRIGHTLVVLEWERPLPLQRVWCVWEMFCAASAVAEAREAGARDGGAAAGAAPLRRAPLLELALPPASRAAFERALTSDFESIKAKLCRIDLRDADAFHGGSGPGSCGRVPGGCPAVAAGKACPDDKAQILGAIERAPGGVDGVTKIVIGALRDWMVGGARRTLAAEPDADRRAGSSLQFYLARILQDCGRLAEAAALLRETAEVRRRTLGFEAENTIAAIGQLASVLLGQGELNEAESLMREALNAFRSALGDAHPSTLTSINNLGSLLKARGDFDGAENLYREVLDALRRTLGGAHPDTLTSMGNLGLLLVERGCRSTAEPLLREVLDARRRTLGDAHPDTLTSMSNLGALLYERGDLAEAVVLLREALAGRRRVLGDAHEDTRDSASWLADALRDLGEFADAALLFREALAAQRLSSGVDSTEALESARNLADLLVLLGDAASVAEASLLAEEALAGLRRNLGEAHASSLIALHVNGRVLAAQGELAGAATAFRASLEGLRATGEDDGEARKSARELAAVLRAQGDKAGAAEVEASVA